MIVLHLESFENKIFELDLSISKKRVSTVKPSQVMKYFFRDSCSFPEIKTPLKISDHVFEKKSNMSQQP